MEASPRTQPLNGLPHNHVRGITGDDAGNLWVLAGDSIMQWQETTGRFIDVTPKDLRIPYWPLLWEGQGSFWGSDPAGIHCFRKGRFVTYPLPRSEEHTSELQSPMYLVCRLL